MQANDDSDSQEDDDIQQDSRSFLPLPISQPTAISSAINGVEPLDWPGIGDNALNEFSTPFLATKCFSTLFPYGTGDPTKVVRLRNVSLTEALKHLNKYGEFVEGSNVTVWTFASHPQFLYWGLDMTPTVVSNICVLAATSRKCKLNDWRSQGNGKHNVRATTDDQAPTLCLKDSRIFATLVPATSRVEVSVRANGPTYLLLDSEFIWQPWPDLHLLLPHSSTSSWAEKCQAVIDCLHIMDWYSTNRLQDFVEHWLKDSLDDEWQWYQIEYQTRGNTHAHGCAKLKNDPGICNLMQKAAWAWEVKTELSDCVTPTEEQQKILYDGAKVQFCNTVIGWWVRAIFLCQTVVGDFPILTPVH